jgi:rhodanese-related sulfurtransferase
MKNSIWIFLLISTSLFSQEKLEKLLGNFNRENIPYISVEELAMPKTKAIILDAREPKEFKVSHIKDAIFVGYNDFNIDETIKKIKDKEAKIVVYCSLGIRSEKIANKLHDKGFTNIFNLYGGIFEWKNNGFIVVDENENPTEKVHAFSKSWSKWLTKGEKVY